jgi:hypothetical protein
MKKKNIFLRVLFGGIIFLLGGYIWYSFLNEGQKRFVKNFLTQIPDLPGRYSL